MDEAPRHLEEADGDARKADPLHRRVLQDEEQARRNGEALEAEFLQVALFNPMLFFDFLKQIELVRKQQSPIGTPASLHREMRRGFFMCTPHSHTLFYSRLSVKLCYCLSFYMYYVLQGT